jgi:uncharacterized repeat protein (TIGR01451 family)
MTGANSPTKKLYVLSTPARLGLILALLLAMPGVMLVPIARADNVITFPSQTSPFEENGHTFTVTGAGYIWHTDYRSAPYCTVNNSTNGDIVITKTEGPNPFQLNHLWLKGDSWASLTITGYNDDTQLYTTGSFNPSATYRQETFTDWTGINKIRIQVNGNGNFFVDDINYTVENVAPTDISLSASIIADGSPSGTVVGTFSTTDSEDPGGHTYSFAAGGPGNASFTISGSDLQTAFVADADTQSSYDIRIRSTDTGGLYVEKDFTITVQPEGIVWDGPTMTFTKADGADWTLEANQDRITDNVWLTRQNSQPLFNIKNEDAYTTGSPSDTEWAYGTTADYLTLSYTDLVDLTGYSMPDIVGQDVVLHLISDNIYIDIRFTSWSSGGSGGSGGFSYERSTPGGGSSPEISLTKTADNDTPDPGQLITYTISIENSSEISATNALVSDTLPSGLTFVGPVTLEGTTGAVADDASDLPTLASGLTITNGHTITLSFPVSVSTGIAGGTAIDNTAAVTATELSDWETAAGGITVQNVAPTAADDTSGTEEDTPLTIHVLDNDSDPNDDTLAVSSVGTANYGMAVISGTTQIVYTPTNRTAGYNGVFTYTVTDGSQTDEATVTVAVTADNDPPNAVDDSDATDAITPVSDTLSVSDPDTDDTLSYGVTAQPVRGAAEIDATGVWTYTPAAHTEDYTVNFSATVTDTASNTDTAVITVSVTANGMPIADAGDDQSVTIGDTVTLDGSGSRDPDGHTPLTYGWAQTGGASVTLSDASAESPTFTAPASETVLTFTLTVTDALGLADPTPDQVLITVTLPANQPPTASDDAMTTVVDQNMTINVVANDSDPDEDPLAVSAATQGAHGSVTFDGGTVTYTPDAGFIGTDTFTYTASDGSLTDTAAVTVAVVGGDRADPVDPAQKETITIDNHIRSSTFLSTTIEFPPGAVPDSTTMVFDEQTCDERSAPSGFYFAGLCFALDAYVGADHQPGITFTQPITLTFYFNRLRRPSLSYWDGSGWSSDGITVIESGSTKMVVTIDHLTEFAILAEESTTYLPLLTNNYSVAPDLIVQSITATSDDVQVVIENQGSAPVVDGFWVEGYVNPGPPPTAVNQLWWDLGNEGMFWVVPEDALPLNPGQTITLAVGDAYYEEDYSRVSWPLAAGTVVYIQVDAWNADTDYGAILEIHEVTGATYNNIATTNSVE